MKRTRRQPAVRFADESVQITKAQMRAVMHRGHRQGDEMACSCGARWPVGEDHP